jgi:glycosyltransferase involved in cell wall biosynthesis
MKVNNLKVSFLIALYNKEKYVIQCVDSCLNQNYKNIEVCIVDDGSTDNSLRIVESYYANNDKVIIGALKVNSGKVVAYNKAYQLSSGKYFALVGADDVNLKNRVSSLLKPMLDKKINMTYGNLIKTDENLNEIELFDGISPKISLKKIVRNNFISGGASLFDSNIANYIFPINEEIGFEDWWISIISILKFRVSFVNTPVALYRLNDTNDNLISNDTTKLVVQNNKKLFKRDFIIYDKLTEHLKNNDFREKKKIKKYILLNTIYKKNYIEENFFKRIHNLFNINFISLNRWYIETIFISIFGSNFDFIKKYVKKHIK